MKEAGHGFFTIGIFLGKILSNFYMQIINQKKTPGLFKSQLT